MSERYEILNDREQVCGYFLTRFGIPPEAFEGVTFLEGGASYWGFRGDVAALARHLELKRVEFLGIRLLRNLKRYLKPTSYALQLFGAGATRNVVDLCRDELFELLRNERTSVEVPPEEDGFVIVRWKGEVLGCGLYLDGVLLSRFPKGRAQALLGAPVL